MLGGLDKSPGSVSLFLICLQPEMDPGIISSLQRTGSSGKLFENPELVSRLSVEGGFVTLDWEAPEDPRYILPGVPRRGAFIQETGG